MLKELLRENRSRILCAVGAVCVILLLGGVGYGVVSYHTQQTAQRTAELLNTLTYTEDAAEQEFETLQTMAEQAFLSDETKGLLNKAMAELSYMTGDDMVYNEQVGRAIFYLEKAGDADSVVYLSNKYIGRLYANGCYAAAQELLEELAAKFGISSFQSDVQAAYYLSCADVEEMLGESPKEDLERAESVISRLNGSENQQLHQAKLDLLKARSLIMEGSFSQAEAVMTQYHAEDTLGLEENNVYVICDFRIPYYEIMTKLLLHRQEQQQAYEAADAYLAYCDRYRFRTMKLRLLQYITETFDTEQTAGMERYKALEKTVAAENLAEMTNEYGAFLLEDIHNVSIELAAQEQAAQQKQSYTIAGVVLVCMALIFFGFGSVFVDYVNKDGLTRLNNRKTYEKVRFALERRKKPYCFLMLDIDDFKKINDSLGHQKGDVVLRRISDLLRRYTGCRVSAYRYGGEELCLIFTETSQAEVRSTAEEIRLAVLAEFTEIRVTVSGGAAVSEAGENVFHLADQCLYRAKATGKNQICWPEE